MPSSIEKKLNIKNMELYLNFYFVKIMVRIFTIDNMFEEKRRINFILESMIVFNVLAIANILNFILKSPRMTPIF